MRGPDLRDRFQRRNFKQKTIVNHGEDIYNIPDSDTGFCSGHRSGSDDEG